MSQKTIERAELKRVFKLCLIVLPLFIAVICVFPYTDMGKTTADNNKKAAITAQYDYTLTPEFKQELRDRYNITDEDIKNTPVFIKDSPLASAMPNKVYGNLNMTIISIVTIITIAGLSLIWLLSLKKEKAK